MAAPGSKPLTIDAPTLRLLQAKLRQKFRGAGGIQVTTSADGSTVSITQRQRRRVAGGGDGSGSGTDGFFPVYVKRNGSSGGNPTYDLFDIEDPGMIGAKLNLSGPLAPEQGRWQLSVPWTSAIDGSLAQACRDADDVIHLYNCDESLPMLTCNPPA